MAGFPHNKNAARSIVTPHWKKMNSKDCRTDTMWGVLINESTLKDGVITDVDTHLRCHTQNTPDFKS